MSSAERQAVSTLIQGSASDVLKLAMIKADEKGLQLAVQIHDQLLVYSKKENAEKDAETLKDCMEYCGLSFCVPIKASIKIVDHWEQQSQGTEVKKNQLREPKRAAIRTMMNKEDEENKFAAKQKVSFY